jgi:hypothetical protein
LSTKLKRELPYDSDISILGIHLKASRSANHRHTCIPRLAVALFTIDKLANQPGCPSTDEWIKKITHTHTYNVAIRKNEIMFSGK